jgi:hypothetical protein
MLAIQPFLLSKAIFQEETFSDIVGSSNFNIIQIFSGGILRLSRLIVASQFEFTKIICEFGLGKLRLKELKLSTTFKSNSGIVSISKSVVTFSINSFVLLTETANSNLCFQSDIFVH